MKTKAGAYRASRQKAEQDYTGKCPSAINFAEAVVLFDNHVD
jgi:hypothetical protein